MAKSRKRHGLETYDSLGRRGIDLIDYLMVPRILDPDRENNSDLQKPRRSRFKRRKRK